MGWSGVLVQTNDSVGPTEKDLGKHIEKLCFERLGERNIAGDHHTSVCA
jgi:hypothetical protein